MLGAIESARIRIGNSNDHELIANFALTLSENPESSKDKWLKIISQDNVYPLIAEINGVVIGKIQARIIDNIGWLEKAKVTPSYRKMGIAQRLIDAALEWIINQNIKTIRTEVDSDNLSARLILEKYNFSANFLAINPSVHVLPSDATPDNLASFTDVVDPDLFSVVDKMIRRHFLGNIMIDGRYLPFDQNIFANLIEERRICLNRTKTGIIIKSTHNLPEEYHAFCLAESEKDYQEIGKAVRAFAAQELAGFSICHAPSKRLSVQGLIAAGYGWNQPHTLIIYQRNGQTNGRSDNH